MAFAASLGDGWKLFKDSLLFLTKKPIFLLPIVFSWFIFAGVVLLLEFYVTFPKNNLGLTLLYIYGFIFIITLSVCMANIMMLEFMQQMESGQPISFGKALKEAFLLDFLKVIPVAAIWALLWVLLMILEALIKGDKDNKSSKESPSMRGAARTLGGISGNPFSWISLGFELFKKLIRMVVFLALPAIAWENKGPFAAFGTSFKIVKTHPVQFLTTYSLTLVAAILMALPILPVFYADDAGVTIPDFVWGLVIFYECIIWTLGIYLEQMSVGLLYLWHLKWQKEGEEGELSSVQKPDLLDDVHELVA